MPRDLDAELMQVAFIAELECLLGSGPRTSTGVELEVLLHRRRLDLRKLRSSYPGFVLCEGVFDCPELATHRCRKGAHLTCHVHFGNCPACKAAPSHKKTR